MIKCTKTEASANGAEFNIKATFTLDGVLTKPYDNFVADSEGVQVSGREFYVSLEHSKADQFGCYLCVETTNSDLIPVLYSIKLRWKGHSGSQWLSFKHFSHDKVGFGIGKAISVADLEKYKSLDAEICAIVVPSVLFDVDKAAAVHTRLKVSSPDFEEMVKVVTNCEVEEENEEEASQASSGSSSGHSNSDEEDESSEDEGSEDFVTDESSVEDVSESEHEEGDEREGGTSEEAESEGEDDDTNNAASKSRSYHFHIYKSILEARSPVFAAMLQESSATSPSIKTAESTPELRLTESLSEESTSSLANYLLYGEINAGELLTPEILDLLQLGDLYELEDMQGRLLTSFRADLLQRDKICTEDFVAHYLDLLPWVDKLGFETERRLFFALIFVNRKDLGKHKAFHTKLDTWSKSLRIEVINVLMGTLDLKESEEVEEIEEEEEEEREEHDKNGQEKRERSDVEEEDEDEDDCCSVNSRASKRLKAE